MAARKGSKKSKGARKGAGKGTKKGAGNRRGRPPRKMQRARRKLERNQPVRVAGRVRRSADRDRSRLPSSRPRWRALPLLKHPEVVARALLVVHPTRASAKSKFWECAGSPAAYLSMIPHSGL